MCVLEYTIKALVNIKANKNMTANKIFNDKNLDK